MQSYTRTHGAEGRKTGDKGGNLAVLSRNVRQNSARLVKVKRMRMFLRLKRMK